jgi:hypothetical protein
VADERLEYLRDAIRRGEERLNRSRAVLAQIKARDKETTTEREPTRPKRA